MENVSLSDVFQMPVDDRIRVAQAIWNSVSYQPEEVQLTDAQRTELERCYMEYLADPNEGSSWSDVKARLLAGR